MMELDNLSLGIALGLLVWNQLSILYERKVLHYRLVELDTLSHGRHVLSHDRVAVPPRWRLLELSCRA